MGVNPDINLKPSSGKMDGKIHRQRNLRKVSPSLDPEALDGLASREAMRAKGAGWRTDWGAGTRPLVKFLEHRVGRKWDKVFSEVSHAFGRTGRELVLGEVLTHTALDAQGLVVVNEQPWCGMLLSDCLGTFLYVHPSDGILRRTGKPYSHHVRTRVLPTAIELGGLAYFRRNGLWFSTPRSSVKELVERLRAHGGDDFVTSYGTLRRRLRRLPELWTHESGKFVCDPDATRQVSTRHAKQLGLDPSVISEVS